MKKIPGRSTDVVLNQAVALKKMAECYRPQFGEETDDLFAALLRPQSKVALINPFLPLDKVLDLIGCAEQKPIVAPHIYRIPKLCKPQVIDGILSHYFLDLASVFSALLLPIGAQANVLDMCAAPGGKLLVMISRLISNVIFNANDSSSTRCFRLKRVLEQFVPANHLSMVKLSTKDAIYFGLRKPASFDAVLLDAPCSSEAHVVQNTQLLTAFRGLKKSLPLRQYALLSAALLALKPAGHVMYATCSINKYENDDVIRKIVHKKGNLIELVSLAAPIGMKTDFGITVLPHLHGAGPAFFSLLKKL